MEKSKVVETAARLFCIVVAIVFVWLFFEYALAVIFPFVIAFCVGVPIYRLSFIIHRKLGIPRKLCAFFLVLLIVAAVGFLLFLAVNRLLGEIEGLIEWADGDSESAGNVIGVIIGYIGDISSKIPFVEEIENIEGLENFRQIVDEKLAELADGFISRVTSSIPTWAMNVIKSAPRVFVTVIVTILACFYFGMDYANFKGGILKLLPDKVRKNIGRFASITGKALKRYGKAYLLIMLITFAEVFVGLLIMGKKYAFLIAAVVAVVDILPVFGAGTVLIPWGIFSFFAKDYTTGAGLLILYGVITIIRQVIEPKIVGESLGIHPLTTLIAMFAGLSLFGVAGMLLGPFVVIAAKELAAGRD